MTEDLTVDRQEPVGRRRHSRAAWLAAGAVVGLLAVRVIAVGRGMAELPIPEECFEYCETGRSAGQMLTIVGIVGLLVAVAVAAGSRIAAIVALAGVVPGLVIVGIGLVSDRTVDETSGLVAIGLALAVFLLARAFWGSFEAN